VLKEIKLMSDLLSNPFLDYQGHAIINQQETFVCQKDRPAVDKVIIGISKALDQINLFNGMTISFHHHLRNGDYVLNLVMKEISQRGYRDITLVASSLFAVHSPLIDMIKNQIITKIYAAYISKEIGEVISRGYCRDGCIMHTHGFRAHMLHQHLVEVDVAFIATPTCDEMGNATGSQGRASCGVLGYAIADAQTAKQVVLITDTIDQVKQPEIIAQWVDYVVKIDEIGDPKGIVSGTTAVTRDPVGLKIATLTVDFIEAAKLLRHGFSFQTGAGGISLAVVQEIYKRCQQQNIKARFASGGTTKFLVDMLNNNYLDKIYDVQCFDLDAVESIKTNANHIKMSAYEYADFSYQHNIASQLDFVVLGATEIDTSFNVNVTTGSDGMIMGGSGGHADTALGAKMTIVVSKLVSSRLSVVVDHVTTITTPSETVDVLITDRGIAIHPRHQELINQLKATTSLPIVSIEQLYQRAIELTGKPKPIRHTDKVVAWSVYSDGTLLDRIYQIDDNS
jgi:citrate lyase subunit alpha / citrate CoA-transferase